MLLGQFIKETSKDGKTNIREVIASVREVVANTNADISLSDPKDTSLSNPKKPKVNDDVLFYPSAATKHPLTGKVIHIPKPGEILVQVDGTKRSDPQHFMTVPMKNFISVIYEKDKDSKESLKEDGLLKEEKEGGSVSLNNAIEINLPPGIPQPDEQEGDMI
jgi:hypothetical protein